MANNYYEATGVLVLDRVTPVIQALFGAFALDESHPGNGQAYIAQIAETTNPQWPDVLDGLEDLATQLGIPMPDDEGCRSRRCSNCSPCTSVPMRTKSWGT
jgi:hypothetical protein